MNGDNRWMTLAVLCLAELLGTVGFGVLSPAALRIAQRCGTKLVVSGGLVLMAIGFALAGSAPASTRPTSGSSSPRWSSLLPGSR